MWRAGYGSNFLNIQIHYMQEQLEQLLIMHQLANTG